MWGFGGKKSPEQKESETKARSDLTDEHGKTFLDELPPKFEDNVKASQQKRESQDPLASGNLNTVIGSIGRSDFENLPQIPCFRQSMLTGGAVGGVVLAVLVITRSSMRRSLNWSVGGFLIASVVSWEQCRFKIRQGKRNTEMARGVYKHSHESK